MKFVLIIMWMGVGNSDIPTVHETRFNTKSACQAAATFALESKAKVGGYVSAVCLED